MLVRVVISSFKGKEAALRGKKLCEVLLTRAVRWVIMEDEMLYSVIYKIEDRENQTIPSAME